MFPFNGQNEKKKSFADKAREEREQRERQRIKQKQDEIRSQAAVVIQSAYRKHVNRKKNTNQLRKLWDIDSGFASNDNGQRQPITSSVEILGLTLLFFAFFKPNDPTDKTRFSHLCRMILSTTNSTSTTKQNTQQAIIPFHSLLLSKCYMASTQKLMKKILWQCVVYVTGHSHNNTGVPSSPILYLSGSELILLIYFLDPKNYVIKGKSTPLDQHLSTFRSYIVDQGFYEQIRNGMILRANSILSFKSRSTKIKLAADDEKKLKSTQLWLTACLRCCLFVLNFSDDEEECIEQSTPLSGTFGKFISRVLSIPCLVSCFDDICMGMIRQYHISSRMIHALCGTESSKKILSSMSGNDTVFLLGNLTELMSRIDIISLRKNEIRQKTNLTVHLSNHNPTKDDKRYFVVQPGSIKFQNFIQSVINLLQHCQKFVSTKQSNTHYQYHPIFMWYSGNTDPNIPASHFNKLINQLEFLWQRQLLLGAFDHILNFRLMPHDNVGPSISKSTFMDKKSSLTSSQTTLLAVETQILCKLYVMLSKLLGVQKHDIMMNLTFLPGFVPSLWKFMMCLGPKGRMKIFLTDAVVKEPEREPLIEILGLFCECCDISLLTLDDEELYEMQTTFTIENDLIPMATFFNKFCFALLSHSSPDNYPPAIFESARRVLLQLHSRDTRRSFIGSDNTWLLIKDPKKSLPVSFANFFKKSKDSNNNTLGTSFLERIRVNEPISLRILNLLPHTIPFETRLEIFRGFLQNSVTSNNDVFITVRRNYVLEDGYKHLGGLTAVRTKGAIRVKFINETGVDEAGVDQGGPFKEFITQLIAEAFDPKRDLFSSTSNNSLYPNPHGTSTKLSLYSFLGRMIARAVQEGILCDVQFAEFFLSKLSGRAVFLEDLIGLNNELWKNLMFLKRYDGNVEDLGLYFAIDEEINGRIITKELRPGGSHMMVTNENRIQYLYLMADYRLNKQNKEQTKAFIDGFQSVIPENWLRMFSPPELQRVISGEDVDWEPSDLRKCAVYQDGYFDQHRCIKNLWSILEDFDSKDRRAFLKFVTSCSKPPLGGFRFLQPQFTVRLVSLEHEQSHESRAVLEPVKAFFNIGNSRSASKGRLPTSSTCFNLLKLPAYSSKSIMREKLKYAINSNTGFELS
ncbi:1607_t:CDS:10 [Acaulospora morrowiae]|uniref:HECT-type E3 ubiquitin transferase n=1 Tax=Acaulospora morrowiae TaxID=94023 RepID=A0A9N8W1B0_9GLOM|nr:1607_t:CDS:10 [Acaulospora morrowiae]